MANIIKSFLGLFVNFFKVVEENRQINIIRSISKDEEGHVIIFISPISSQDNYQMYPHQIITNHLMRGQFRRSDIKILESIIITEGDIFIDSKEYKDDNELYTLKSALNQEIWILSEKEIIDNKEIFNRLNQRYFKKHLNSKPNVANHSGKRNHG